MADVQRVEPLPTSAGLRDDGSRVRGGDLCARRFGANRAHHPFRDSHPVGPAETTTRHSPDASAGRTARRRPRAVPPRTGCPSGASASEPRPHCASRTSSSRCSGAASSPLPTAHLNARTPKPGVQQRYRNVDALGPTRAARSPGRRGGVVHPVVHPSEGIRCCQTWLDTTTTGAEQVTRKPRSTDRPSVAALASVFHFAVGLLVDRQSIGGGSCASKQRCRDDRVSARGGRLRRRRSAGRWSGQQRQRADPVERSVELGGPWPSGG